MHPPVPRFRISAVTVSPLSHVLPWRAHGIQFRRVIAVVGHLYVFYCDQLIEGHFEMVLLCSLRAVNLQTERRISRIWQ